MLISKGLGWLLMARFTPCSRADVAQMWPRTSVAAASQSHAVLLAYSRIPTVVRNALCDCEGDRDEPTRMTGSGAFVVGERPVLRSNFDPKMSCVTLSSS